MNNIPYLFMPDMNMMNTMSPYNPNYHNNDMMELIERVNKLSRDVRKLERRVSQLEKKNQPYVKKTNVDDDDSGIYMM